MRYRRYMEFVRSNAVVSLYFYDNRIDIHGFGTVDTVRPTGGVTPARIEEAVQVMRAGLSYGMRCAGARGSLRRAGGDDGQMKQSLPYIDKATLDRIRAVDLLTYLQQTAPGDLYRRSTEYRLHSHPRFNISYGKWHDFDREIGGVSALDYFVKIHGMPFLEAAHMILQQGLPELSHLPAKAYPPRKDAKPFTLPERNATMDMLNAYLRKRGIGANVIRQCADLGILYESRKHNNCVFVGRDAQGEARYAFLRGTLGDFKMEVSGSIKRFGFRLPGVQGSGAVAIFESPVDALSHASLYPGAEMDRLSLGGTSGGALTQYLADHPNVRRIYAYLDNDDAGRKAVARICATLSEELEFHDTPPPEGKDYNEYLLIKKRRERGKAREPALSL